MVMESTQNTRQKSERPSSAPDATGMGRSPTRFFKTSTASATPIAMQTRPGTMNAARHEESVISTPGTMP